MSEKVGQVGSIRVVRQRLEAVEFSGELGKIATEMAKIVMSTGFGDNPSTRRIFREYHELLRRASSTIQEELRKLDVETLAAQVAARERGIPKGWLKKDRDHEREEELVAALNKLKPEQLVAFGRQLNGTQPSQIDLLLDQYGLTSSAGGAAC